MTGQELALHGDDERALAHLMARASVVAKMPGLKEQLAGNTDAVAAVMISLEGYGLPTTAQGINTAFDWIQGRAEMSSQMYQALAHKNGYDIIPLVRTAERAVARVERRGRPPIEVEFTVADAQRAGRLKEWVESVTWEKYDYQGQSRNRKITTVFTVSDNGVPSDVDVPAWAQKEIAAGRIKRYDAWWNYRADMLWKSAAKRAVKIAAPHVLLGVFDNDDDVPDTWESPTGAPAAAVDDEEIFEAEIVEHQPSAAGSPPEPAADAPRPVSPPPSGGEAAPAQTAPFLGQEGAAPAGEPNQPHLYDDPDERPF